jgi:hypothetical protein
MYLYGLRDVRKYHYPLDLFREAVSVIAGTAFHLRDGKPYIQMMLKQ